MNTFGNGMINRVIASRYKIREHIGSSSLAEDYTAIDQKSDRRVIIHIFKEEVKKLPLASQLHFKRRLETISKADHRNLLKIYAVGEFEGRYYTVTENFPGQPLSQYLAQPIAVDRAVEMILQLSSCLSLCHQKGTIHGRINPDNILVSSQVFQDGEPPDAATDTIPYVKVTNFGYSSLLDLTLVAGAGTIQTIFGYLSPEASGILRRPIDERTDIYSIGILFYRLVTGELPYKAQDVSALVYQHIAQRPEPPGTINKAVPEVLDRIILRLIAKEPQDRYQSLSGLIADLDKYKAYRKQGGRIDFPIALQDRVREITYSTRLFGREKELHQLKVCIENTRESKGALILVYGEAGVGKSKLVDEAAGHVQSIRGIFAGGKCNQFEFQTPYKIFSEIIRAYLEKLKRRCSEEQEVLRKRIKDTLGDLAGEIVKIAPEMTELTGESGRLAELETEKERTRFLITVTNFIVNLGTPEIPVILFFDDLQWADEGSIELFGRIAEKAGSYPLLIIGGFRDTELGESHPLRQTVEKLEIGGTPPSEIHLENLGIEDTRKIISQILTEDEDTISPLADDIYQKSRGNPFFLVETLHYLVEEGIVYRKDNHYSYDASRGIKAITPESVVEVVLKRTQELSAENREILSYAAVMGREIQFEILMRISHQAPEVLLSAIEEGIKRQLVMGDISRRENICFVHDRIREAFYQRLKEEDRIPVHRLIGEYFERESKDSESFLYALAYHFTQAKIEDRALPYSIQAGHKARASYAHNQAVELYTTARRILEKQGKTKTPQYAEILESLGEIYRLTGRFTESLEALRICEVLVPASDKLHRAQLLYKIGNTLWEKGEVEEAIESLVSALKMLNLSVPRTQAGVMAGLAGEFLIQMAHTWFPKVFIRRNYCNDQKNLIISRIFMRLAYIYYFSDMDRMFYFYIKALNFTEKKIGPCTELAHLYVTGPPAFTLTIFPWLSRAFRDGRLGIEMARRIGDRIQEGRGYCYFSMPLFISNRPGEAREYAQESIDLLKKLGEYWELGMGYFFRDHHNCLLGRSFQENIRDNEEFVRAMQEAKVMQALGWALVTKGRVFSRLGKVDDQIIDDLQKSIELLEKTADHFVAGFALSVLAFAYSRREEHDKAIDAIEKSRDYYFRYHTGCYFLDMFTMGAEVYLRKILYTPALSIEERKKCLPKGAWYCRQSMRWGKRFPYIFGWACQVNGTYYWLSGNKEKAKKLWEKGIKFLREHTEDTYRLGHILLQEASLLLQDNSRDSRAYEYLLEARELFIRTDAQGDLAWTNKLLDGTGRAEKDLESCETLTQKRYLESLLSMTEAVGSIFNLEELLDRVMDYALKATGAERGALFLYGREDNRLRPAVVRGMKKDIVEQSFAYDSYRISLEMIHAVEKSQEAVIAAQEGSALPEPQGHCDGQGEGISRELRNYGIKEALCIPLRAQGKCLGMIYLDNSLAGGIFSQEALNLMKSFAVQAAVSIENAHLVKNLVDQERFMQALIEQAPDMVFVHDTKGRIINANQRVCDSLGYTRTELLNMTVADFEMNYDREKIPSILQAIEKIPVTFSGVHRRKDGSTYPVEIKLSSLEYHGRKLILALVRDITERKKMEEEMQKIQKLESLGILAGGIAHDFNNLLTAIIGNVSLIELNALTGKDIGEIVEEVKKASKQAKRLTQQLLTFSKGGKPIKKSIALTKLFQEAQMLALSGSQVKCELFIADDLWCVEADEGQISQVINNIMINANQAMPEGGTITVHAENVTLESKDNGFLKSGRYVKISMRDQGGGIPQEHVQKIFDPFFTTKEKGSGLGLAITYSIVKKHEGHITVESTPGIGTTFTFYLPASERETPVQQGVKREKPLAGKGNVLIMDDQVQIRKMTERILTHLGYQVESAQDGAEAVELYKKHKEAGQGFDAVILDLTVPGGMGGREAMQKLRQLDPDVKAVVSSGYFNDPVISEYQQYGFKGVVAKPFEMKELNEVLLKVIRGEG
ncbi:MAG: AAA family ATPase [bacterium]